MAAEWLRADQMAAMTLRAAQVDDDLRPLSHSQLGKVLQQDVPALAAQDGRWRALVGELLAELRAMEWLPARNMAGGLTDFCPVCHGTPSVSRLNPRTARPDGHWLSTPSYPNGCPLATVIEQAQAVLADAPPAHRGDAVKEAGKDA